MASKLSSDVAARVLKALSSSTYIPEGDAALFCRYHRSDRTPQFLTHGAISESNMLRLGSLTKMFLAYVALKHQVPLDQTVQSQLHRLESSHYASSDVITFRQLMNHTSGVFSYTEIPDVTKLAETYTPPLIVDLAWKNRPLMFSPGSAWFYSNTNSEIVATWLMSVTQRTPRELIDAEFRNQGLNSLTLDTGEKFDYPMSTSGYRDFNMPYTFPSASGTLIGRPIDAILALDRMANDTEIWTAMKSWAEAPRFPDPDNPAGGQKYGLFLQEFGFKNNSILAYGHDGHIGVSTVAFESGEYIYLLHATLEFPTEKWMAYVNSIMEEVL